MNNSPAPVSGSFRDPSGFLFTRDGRLYRQINVAYRQAYDQLMNSGLYDHLTSQSLLVAHEEDAFEPLTPDLAYKVIRPEQIPFISYPYEWSFSQLKDAALLTLKIQKKALKKGMSLKDASAYNVQFKGCRPVFIDTLSFEPYQEGKPWVAYRQFCQHFLAPLLLMSYQDIRLNQMLRIWIDGLPLDMVSRLLPRRTRFKLSLLSHIHLHAKSQKRYADKPAAPSSLKMSKRAFLGLIDSLETALRQATWKAEGTEWGEYYNMTNYSSDAFILKQNQVKELLGHVRPRSVWDLGANTGVFSRLAAGSGAYTVAFDLDPAAVEKNYLLGRAEFSDSILPLCLDLSNPSPGIGWANCERMSLAERGPVDMVMALALIHHLAISNNLPFAKIADYLSTLGAHLIIEFVPKNDSQVQKLLASRADIFPDYTCDHFEEAFARNFEILAKNTIAQSNRILYLMKKRPG